MSWSRWPVLVRHHRVIDHSPANDDLEPWGGGGSTVAAYFDGDPSTAFSVDGMAVGRHEVDVDAGVNLVDEGGSLFLRYQGTIRKEMSDHGVHAVLTIGPVRKQLSL